LHPTDMFAVFATSAATAALGYWFGQARIRARVALRLSALDTSVLAVSQERDRLTTALAAADARIGAVSTALSGEVERRCAAEERCLRVPALEQQLSQATSTLEARQSELGELKANNARLLAERGSLADAHQRVAVESSAHAKRTAELQNENGRLASELATATARLDASNEQLAKVDALKTQMAQEFQLLASKILDENSKKFTEQNHTNLAHLLDPLRERITEFQRKVEDTYSLDAKERTSLTIESRQLEELNRQMTQDATNLTSALKGDNKVQGTWGEFVLESVLTSSGLREVHEFSRQAALVGDDGARRQPDIVINFPDNRHLVIDAKMSLGAYEQYARADSEGARESALRGHLLSVRTHIKKLSDKDYQSLYSLNSLDFVLMFIPVEPAFMLAIMSDRELYMDAWHRNIVLVSPSTLLATLRVVSDIWRREHQSRNAQEIARHCASIYDKFVGFVKDLEEVRVRLAATQRSYDDARSKLSTGRGNLVGQIERMRALGVKPQKTLPTQIASAALDAEDGAPPPGSVPRSDSERPWTGSAHGAAACRRAAEQCPLVEPPSDTSCPGNRCVQIRSCVAP
jgi:DNA recombination protein RmuC